MNKFCLLTAAGVFALLPLAVSAANGHSVTVEKSYVLHQHDTLAYARAMLDDQIKREAAESLGEYVAIETHLSEDGIPRESLYVLNSALIEENRSQEQVTTDADGRLILTVSKTLQVDPESLERRIEALHQNHEQKLALRQLADENDRLREELGRLMRHEDAHADPVTRAKTFEQWRHDHAQFSERAVSLQDIAEAQEAVVAQELRDRHAPDALHYRLVAASRVLQGQLRTEIEYQTRVGEHLELKVRVSGLHNAEALLRDALGFPLAEDGLLHPADYRTWSKEVQSAFRNVLPRLTQLPVYVTVEAGHELNAVGGFVKTTRRGYPDGRHAGQSHLLFGTLLYEPSRKAVAGHFEDAGGSWGKTLSEKDYFAEDSTGFAGRSGKRLTIGLNRQSESRLVERDGDDSLIVTLRLSAKRGVPPHIVPRVAVGNWNLFQSQTFF